MKSKFFRIPMVVGILVLLAALITQVVYTALPQQTSSAEENKPTEASVASQAQDLASEPAESPSEDPTVVYTYDDAGRLIKVEYSGGTVITYSYDAVGNRLTREIFRLGDANGDGDVDVFDLVMVKRIILELDPSTPGADADLDGDVDVFDLVKVKRIILGID